MSWSLSSCGHGSVSTCKVSLFSAAWRSNLEDAVGIRRNSTADMKISMLHSCWEPFYSRNRKNTVYINMVSAQMAGQTKRSNKIVHYIVGRWCICRAFKKGLTTRSKFWWKLLQPTITFLWAPTFRRTHKQLCFYAWSSVVKAKSKPINSKITFQSTENISNLGKSTGPSGYLQLFAQDL